VVATVVSQEVEFLDVVEPAPIGKTVEITVAVLREIPTLEIATVDWVCPVAKLHTASFLEL